MLNITIDEELVIVIIEPDGKLSASDFQSAVKIIDPYIDEVGKLQGLIIASEKFPGWQDFAALASHLVFIQEHHKKIANIALVTNTALGNLAEHIVKHFVSAHIKAFDYSQIYQAKSWITLNHTNT